ncbi:MAG: CHAT domain-containing protein [Leptolyngbya sp. DLM2.Bin27]|nr:MAG: CHAT domain-containing protein [Leptolyngbya sp. DLM2.Bin27]
MQKILILAANPKDTSRLRLDEELRDIQEGLRRAKHRDQFAFAQRLAVRPRDIQRAMLEETPQIVHFSGHGEGAEGLVFETETGQTQLVSGVALANLFALFADPAEPNPIHCVVLNGCYSAVQAEAIAEQVPYVVGMTKAVGDTAAIEFAVGFYDALGAGRTVEFAYKLGCAAINLAGKPESATPVLIHKKAPTTSPTTPAATPNAMTIPQDRTKLYQFLLSLPGPQFDAVVFDLNPPRGNVPPSSAPQGDRVAALLHWVESPIGPATKLEAVRTALANLLNPQ